MIVGFAGEGRGTDRMLRVHPLFEMRGLRLPRRTLLLVWLVALWSSAARAAESPNYLEQAREHHRRGELTQAISAYRVVLENPATTAEQAVARNNLCLLFESLGDNSAALPECRQAVDLRRSEQGTPGAALARALNNLSIVLQNLGEFAEAESLLVEALELNRRLSLDGAQAVNLGNLGTLTLETGDFDRSMDFFQQAEKLAQERIDEPWAASQKALASLNQAVVLENVGAFRESLALLKKVGTSGDLPPEYRTSYEIRMGVVLRNLGDPVRAIEAFEEALRDFRALGDIVGQANAWLNLGIARHFNLGQLTEARASYREALTLARESRDRGGEIQALYYLGRLHLDQGNTGSAEASFRECLHLAQESGIQEGEWSAYEGLGRCSRRQGDLERAAELLERAIEILEGQRARFRRTELREGYFGDRRSPYSAAVEAYAVLERKARGQGAARRALELVQQAKARELLENLGSARSRPHPMTADQIVAAVGDGRLLELFVAEGRVFGWWVEGGGIELFDLGDWETIQAAVAEVHGDLASNRPLSETSVEVLSTHLVDPLPTGSLVGGKLWISPDRSLHYLPFELLESRGGSPARQRWVERATIAYLPSASGLGWLRQREPTGAEIRFVGFALPTGSAGGRPQGLSASLLMETEVFSSLPAAEGELISSSKKVGGAHRLFLGNQASEASFREASTEGSRIVHLATHTVIREVGGDTAAVLLSPSGEDDGLLFPAEIAALDLQIDLSVLASCRTALGAGEEARALSSLSGSFLAAGSRAVLATLWDVGDEATAAFMEQFYHQLRRGLPPAAALRNAKLRFLADPDWSDPSLWAAYVLIGDPPAILPRSPLRRRLGVGLFVLLFLFGISRLWRLADRVKPL